MSGPEYRLAIKLKDGNYNQTIGAGWVKSSVNGDFISISLQPGTVLSWRDTEDCFISLFKNDSDGTTRKTEKEGGRQQSYAEELDDEIPF